MEEVAGGVTLGLVALKGNWAGRQHRVTLAVVLELLLV